MYFDYNEYRKYNLIIPIIQLIAVLCFAVINLIEMVNAIQRGQSYAYEIGAIFLLLPFTIATCSVLRTGWYLLFENIKDSQYSEGQIQKIQSISIAPRYYIEGKPVRPSWVYINGTKYYFMNASNLVVGRYITFSYLPKSSFVLHYDYL